MLRTYCCSMCGFAGHNKRSCPKTQPATRPPASLNIPPAPPPASPQHTPHVGKVTETFSGDDLRTWWLLTRPDQLPRTDEEVETYAAVLEKFVYDIGEANPQVVAQIVSEEPAAVQKTVLSSILIRPSVAAAVITKLDYSEESCTIIAECAPNPFIGEEAMLLIADRAVDNFRALARVASNVAATDRVVKKIAEKFPRTQPGTDSTAKVLLTPAETYETLWSLLANPGTPGWIIEEIYQGKYLYTDSVSDISYPFYGGVCDTEMRKEYVHRLIAWNINTPAHILDRITEQSAPAPVAPRGRAPLVDQFGHAVMNPNVSEETVRKVFSYDQTAATKNERPRWHTQIAQSPHVPPEAVPILTENPNTALHLAENPNLPGPSLALFGNSPDAEIRAALIRNPSTPDDTIHEIAKKSGTQIQKRAVLRPNLAERTLTELALSPNSFVAQTARTRLALLDDPVRDQKFLASMGDAAAATVARWPGTHPQVLNYLVNHSNVPWDVKIDAVANIGYDTETVLHSFVDLLKKRDQRERKEFANALSLRRKTRKQFTSDDVSPPL